MPHRRSVNPDRADGWRDLLSLDHDVPLPEFEPGASDRWTSHFLKHFAPRPRQRKPAIARRRFFRPGEGFTRGPRVNEQIRKTPIRVIHDDEQLGVMETSAALQRAREQGLDLVEVHAESDPPVCRILDYGKFRYDQSKKDKANKAKSKTAELKEVRLGRSMKIDPHDVGIRMNQARKFLMEGHKVQIVQNFRGREMIHRERGTERLDGIVESLADIAKLEVPARLNGRRMTMILAPDKPKIEAIKRKKAREAGNAKSAPAEEPDVESASTDPSDDSGEHAVETPTPEAAETAETAETEVSRHEGAEAEAETDRGAEVEVEATSEKTEKASAEK